MVQEYESVSSWIRSMGPKWAKGADEMDRLAKELKEKGDLPPNVLGNTGDQRIFSHPDFDLDGERREVILKGRDGYKAVKLRPQEYKLLDLFSRNLDVVLTREDILREIWPRSGGNAHLLTAHLSRLRHKLGGDCVYLGIEAVENVGYVLRSGSGEGERAGH